MNLRQKLIKYLKVKVVGVALESELPAEFIITDHAFARLKERTGSKKDKFDVMCAWYYGTEPPKEFKPEKCKKPPFIKNFVYRYYEYSTYVFGIKPFNGNSKINQKILITVLPM